jgi:hypothetical protein
MFVKSRDGTAPSRVSTVTATVVVVLIRCFITVSPLNGYRLSRSSDGFSIVIFFISGVANG